MAIIKKVFPGKEKEIAEKAARIMKEGGVIVFPTESSYGIGVDATNEKAIKKIALIKQQSEEKNISIIVSNLEQAEQFGFIKEDAKKLAERFMPGPLTLVVKKSQGFQTCLAMKQLLLEFQAIQLQDLFAQHLATALLQPVQTCMKNQTFTTQEK